MKRVYMDANATTPLAPEVFTAMRPWLLDRFGNASSIHQHGQHARAAVEEARESVAALLHCRPSEIVLTAGGTEGDNLALFGLTRPGDHLITSTIEHHAVLHAAEELQRRGIEVSFVRVGADCLVDPGEVRAALRPNTRLISIMTANNETGVLQPVEEIGRIAAEAGVAFHTDAVQGAGKLPLDPKAIGCCLLTLGGHKMYGPQGVGALYVRSGTHLEPLFYGGAHERQRRAGTENVAGIVGFGKAAELAAQDLAIPGEPESQAGSIRRAPSAMHRVAALRDRLESGLLSRIEEVTINAGQSGRVPNTTNLCFHGIEGEALVIALDLKGLAVSSGSACSSGATDPSHVLLAMGLSQEEAKASLRFSLTKDATQEDIDFALDLVPKTVNRLRELASVSA